jgi:hypothetical protein
MSWRLSALVLFATACTGFAGCDFMIDSMLADADETSYEEMAKSDDEYGAELVAGKNQDGEYLLPASEFFAEGSPHKIWKGDRAIFKKLCEDSIAAGAPAAHAILSKDVPFCSSYLITMPTDKAARAKVIEVHNQFWKNLASAPVQGGDPDEDPGVDMDDDMVDYMAKDVGQKYLHVIFDP